MQKVVGSSPIIRFGESPHSGLSGLARVAGMCVVARNLVLVRTPMRIDTSTRAVSETGRQAWLL
jgi:hypothetical protein